MGDNGRMKWDELADAMRRSFDELALAADQAAKATEAGNEQFENAMRTLTAGGALQEPLLPLTDAERAVYANGFLEFPIRGEVSRDDGRLTLWLDFPLHWTPDCDPLGPGQQVTLIGPETRIYAHVAEAGEQSVTLEPTMLKIRPLESMVTGPITTLVRMPQFTADPLDYSTNG